MKHSHALCAVALALLGTALVPAARAYETASPVSVAAGRPAVEMPVASIAEWVAREMGVALPDTLPQVAFATRQQLAALRYAGGRPGPGREIEALYQESTRTLLMPHGWTGDSIGELSVLAHEMVHFLQDVAGQQFPCGLAREVQAYDVQDAWLRAAGTSLETEFGINGMTRLLLTSCGYH